jgi:xanthosine utilization system XapX-like protein
MVLLKTLGELKNPMTSTIIEIATYLIKFAILKIKVGVLLAILRLPIHAQVGIMLYICMYVGRAIAQAVSRRLPTEAARFQTQVWSCGIL